MVCAVSAGGGRTSFRAPRIQGRRRAATYRDADGYAAMGLRASGAVALGDNYRLAEVARRGARFARHHPAGVLGVGPRAYRPIGAPRSRPTRCGPAAAPSRAGRAGLQKPIESYRYKGRLTPKFRRSRLYPCAGFCVS